eukprot:scaffold35161_cov64-Phaeocystis_antarctica.AAC.4
MKEFEWRNGWFDAISRRERAAGRPEPLPRHSAALRQLGFSERTRLRAALAPVTHAPGPVTPLP